MYEIGHLNVITSSLCDLKCSYCFLHKDKVFRSQDKKIVQAWLDGTYISNIRKVFQCLDCDLKKVHTISLWGGEPFIHLKEIKFGIQQLVSDCYNITSFHVPTNWVHTNISDLCNLLQVVNNSVAPRKKDNLVHFHIQVSIDGIDHDIFMQEGHNGTWEKYIKNFDILCENLEKMYLPNLSVDFCVSGTGNLHSILHHFSDQNNINKHIQFWSKISEYAINKTKNIKNPDVLINSLINFPTVAIPNEASIEDGLALNNLGRITDYLLYKNNAIYNQDDSFSTEYYNCENDWPVCGPNIQCFEANQSGITLYYDGTICQCPDGFIDNLDEYQNEFLEKKEYHNWKVSKISSTHFFNPLTASQKEIEDHRWYTILGGFKDTYFPYIQLEYALAEELALSHQIDYNYYLDPMKLLLHLESASMLNECFRNNVITTGLPYLPDIGGFRRWLNGWVAEARETYIVRVKEMIQQFLAGKKINDIKEKENMINE